MYRTVFENKFPLTFLSLLVVHLCVVGVGNAGIDRGVYAGSTMPQCQLAQWPAGWKRARLKLNLHTRRSCIFVKDSNRPFCDFICNCLEECTMLLLSVLPQAKNTVQSLYKIPDIVGCFLH
jgi:hypothetical protein